MNVETLASMVRRHGPSMCVCSGSSTVGMGYGVAVCDDGLVMAVEGGTIYETTNHTGIGWADTLCAVARLLAGTTAEDRAGQIADMIRLGRIHAPDGLANLNGAVWNLEGQFVRLA